MTLFIVICVDIAAFLVMTIGFIATSQIYGTALEPTHCYNIQSTKAYPCFMLNCLIFVADIYEERVHLREQALVFLHLCSTGYSAINYYRRCCHDLEFFTLFHIFPELIGSLGVWTGLNSGRHIIIINIPLPHGK